MKRPTLLLIVFVGLLLLFAIGGFGSSANSNKTESRTPGFPSGRGPLKIEPERKTDAETAKQSDDEAEEDDSDPDLGKFSRKIDREEYLRLRDEYVARKRGIEPGRPFDPRARGRAIEQMQRRESDLSGKNSFFGSIANLLGFEVSAGPAWTSIGPSPLPNGQVSGNGPVTGRVTAVVVDPTNPNIVYLGAAQGGVWRSTNAGATWVAIFDDAQSLSIGALALSPSEHTTLYVGTGEFNGCGDCFFGAGLYRIDNADTTATLVGPINPSTTVSNLTYNIFTGRSISKILVHPTDPNTIFVATGTGVGGSGANSLSSGIPPMGTRGVYRSTNAKAAAGSVTFQKLVINTDNSFDSPPTGNVTVADMVMDPGNPNNILVGVIGQSQPGGVYHSTNALATTPTFTQDLSLTAGVRTSLAVSNVAGTVTAYAATSETPVPTPVGSGCTSSSGGSLHKSTNPFDASPTWSGQIPGAAGFCQQQCFYDMPIAVEPGNANVVYLGGQSGSNASLVCGGVVRKSTDGGTTFANDSNGLHADAHAFFFDTIGNIYAGNDGGVWKRSSSAGANTAWTNLNQAPLSTLQFESVAVHPVDQFFTIGGTQDNGTEAQTLASGNWKRAEGGDGGYTLIDQSATDTTSVTMYLTFFNRSNSQIMFDRATLSSCLNTIDSWPTRGTFTSSSCGSAPCPDNSAPAANCDNLPFFKNNGIQISDNVLFYAPMALGPGTPNTLYFGTDRLYRSTDRGDNMTIVGGTTTAPLVPTGTRTPLGGGAAVSVGSPISSIAISPQDDNYRIVGLQNGRVWATSTGASLIELTNPFPANPNTATTNKFVGRAMIDPNNKNVAYMALSYFAPAGQGVWKITNLGAAAGSSPVAPVWTVVGNGIPSIPINAFAIDPLNSNNLFAGTDIGVYNSTDGGANWVPYGTGLPRVAVFDMKIQNTSRILRVATHGRGMWEISIGAAATPTPTPTPIAYSVSGRVADAGNNSISGATILFEMNFQGTMTTRTVQTDSNGNFNSGDVGCQNNVKATPSKTAYTFSPLAMAFVNSGGCLTGSGTANFTATPQGPTIFVEDGAANQAVALDSVTLVRGPFNILTDHNFSADHHTRVILFTSDLGLSQPGPSLTVQAGGVPLLVENVGTLGVAGLVASSYIVVRLPDGLPAGNLTLIVTLNGAASSNSPTLAISQ